MIADAALLAIAAVANLIRTVVEGQPKEFQAKQWERFDRFLSHFDPPPSRQRKRRKRVAR